MPPPPPGAPDGIVGVAPHAVIISIRQSSRAFEPVNPGPGDMEGRKKGGTIASLASAIVHAANMGAKVINVSVTACVSAADPLDQGAIGAAVWYAATVKDAVIVAAAGNDSEDGCAQNPTFDPLNASDSRDWHQVKTVSSPSWFSDYVLSVGAVDNSGTSINKSLAGPWVAAAAPGVGIMGLSPATGGPANAYPPIHPGDRNTPFWGTSFSAAYVSGVAALVRAKPRWGSSDLATSDCHWRCSTASRNLPSPGSISISERSTPSRAAAPILSVLRPRRSRPPKPTASKPRPTMRRSAPHKACV